MKRTRSATSVIWATVVSSAAMLGTVGCHGGGAPTTPASAPADELATVELATVEPAPVEPAPVEPAPVEPVAVEPVAAIDPVAPMAAAKAAPPAAPEREAPAVMVDIMVTSTPSGAEVYRGDTKVGTTPLKMTVAATHTDLAVQVKLAGYVTQRKVVKADKTQALKVTLAKARVRGVGVKKNVGRGFVLS